MSLFKKTVDELDSLDAAIAALPGSPTADRKPDIDAIATRLNEASLTLQSFSRKADAGERDPSKRLYGDAMVAKIRAAAARVPDLEASVEAVKGAADAAWEQHQQLLREQHAAEEAERLRKEEEAKRAADAAAAEERRLKELAAAEDERLRVERKRKAEEEAARKLEQEEQARLRKIKEDEDKRLKREREHAEEERAAEEAVEAARRAEAASKLTISVKTTKGRSYTVGGIAKDASVADLKAAISKESGIGRDCQKLIFAGRVLDDSATMSGSRILDGVTVHMVEKELPYPSGSVLHISRGAEELDAIIAACSRANRLLMVDFNAPWCGPCRMIAPEFENLAVQHTNVSFASVDTEASPPNMALARRASVSALPTFHAYVRGRKCDEMRGASLGSLTEMIERYTTEPESASSSSAGVSAPSSSSAQPLQMPAGSNMTERVMSSLVRIKNSCATLDFIQAVDTLLTFVRNVVTHPDDPKYRRVRWSNGAFQSRVASRPGGPECMLAFGFQEQLEGGDRFLVLPAESATNPELATVMSQLEAALTRSRGTAGSARTQPVPPPPNPAPATGLPGGFPGGFPGMPGVGTGQFPGNGGVQGLMNNPAFAQMAGELMNDPNAMNDLMQAQRAMQAGDTSAILAMQNNPTLQRMQQRMMQNPELMGAMAGLGGGMGAGAGAGGGLAMPGVIPPTTATGQAGAEAPAGGGLAMPGVIPPTTATGQAGADPPAGGAAEPGPTLDGEPTTAEEEERLLAEAIRLSMNESNEAFNQNNKRQDEREGDDDK